MTTQTEIKERPILFAGEMVATKAQESPLTDAGRQIDLRGNAESFSTEVEVEAASGMYLRDNWVNGEATNEETGGVLEFSVCPVIGGPAIHFKIGGSNYLLNLNSLLKELVGKHISEV